MSSSKNTETTNGRKTKLSTKAKPETEIVKASQRSTAVLNPTECENVLSVTRQGIESIHLSTVAVGTLLAFIEKHREIYEAARFKTFQDFLAKFHGKVGGKSLPEVRSTRDGWLFLGRRLTEFFPSIADAITKEALAGRAAPLTLQVPPTRVLRSITVLNKLEKEEKAKTLKLVEDGDTKAYAKIITLVEKRKGVRKQGIKVRPGFEQIGTTTEIDAVLVITRKTTRTIDEETKLKQLRDELLRLFPLPTASSTKAVAS